MKKIISLLLIFASALLLFACVKPCTDHIDEDGDGVCDTPGCYEGLKPGNNGDSPFGDGGVELPPMPIPPDYD